MTTRYMYIGPAATYLGITVKALRKRIEHRSIPFCKDGRRIRFDAVMLDRYMAQRVVVTPGQCEPRAHEGT